MRTGDPMNAKSGKTWTSEHKPFASAVQTKLPTPSTAMSAPEFVAKSGPHIGLAVSASQFGTGQLNRSNGGVQRGPVGQG